MINQTDFHWHLGISRAADGKFFAAEVPPRATQTIDLTGADYRIEQRTVADEAGPELTRQIPVRLQPGKTYRWRLVTLLSEPTP